MTPTPQEIADVLDGASDELLTRGRCLNDLEDEAGRVCIYQAIGLASERIQTHGRGLAMFRGQLAMEEAAKDALRVHIPTGNIVGWNRDSTDDEVFDLLRNTAKELRA